MSSTELVVKAGHTNADLLNFGSVTGGGPSGQPVCYYCLDG